jgi:hypothetical protein
VEEIETSSKNAAPAQELGLLRVSWQLCQASTIVSTAQADQGLTTRKVASTESAGLKPGHHTVNINNLKSINLKTHIQKQIPWKTQTTKTQKEIGNLNSLIAIKEIDFVAKTFPKRKL